MSCLCVTEDRAAFMPWLLWNYRKQDHRARELVIVDSSHEPLTPPGDASVRVMRCPSGTSVARKRNLAVEAARGALVTWFDDDDWQHPRKLSILAAALGADGVLAGSTRSWFIDLRHGRARPYEARRSVIFNGLGARRAALAGVRFDELRARAADTAWVSALRRSGMRVVPEVLSCWLCHDANVSNPASRYVFPHALADVGQAVGAADWGDTERELTLLRAAADRNPRAAARVGRIDRRKFDQEDAMRGVRVALIVGALLWAPATAAAAEKPVATTGGAANVQPTTVVLNGTVNPKGADTTYFFQYGTTRLFGLGNAPASAGAGNKGVKVAIAIGELAPFTTYHYRLVAQNSKGLTLGARRTFKTKRQPLGVSLAANPNPVSVGGLTTLSGVLSGTGNGGRNVVLLSNPWPYTQGFLPVGNVLVTNADGSFSSTVATVPVNTQFVVQMPAKPEVLSPIVVVGTTVKVTRHVNVQRGDRRGRLRFHGRVRPAVDGREVIIQKLRRSNGTWMNIARTVTRFSGGSWSRYRKTIRQRRGGRYRVLVVMDDKYSSSGSRSFKVRRVRS